MTPMVELLTHADVVGAGADGDPSRTRRPAAGDSRPRCVADRTAVPPATGAAGAARRAARGRARSCPQQTTRQSRRAKDQRNARTHAPDREADHRKDDPRELEPRESHPGAPAHRGAGRAERRDGRRSERRYRDRDEAEEVDAVPPDAPWREVEDRRQRDGERRVVVREEVSASRSSASCAGRNSVTASDSARSACSASSTSAERTYDPFLDSSG